MRVARLKQTILDFGSRLPITDMGVFFLFGVIVLFIGLARPRLDLVLTAVAYVGAITFVLAALSTLGGALRLRRVFAGQYSPPSLLHLECGVATSTGLVWPGLRFFPFVYVQVSWAMPFFTEVSLKTVATGLSETVIAAERGSYREIHRRIIVGDILGLTRWIFRRVERREVRVFPRRIQLRALPQRYLGRGDDDASFFGAGTGDLVDLRTYAHGDPLQRVVWKAYARSRELIVRTPEPAHCVHRAAAAYFIAGAGDHCTAQVARYFLDHGLLGDDFWFMADGGGQATRSVAQGLIQIADSVTFRSTGGNDLGRFCRQIITVYNAAPILFVPELPGAWIDRLERVANELKNALVIVGKTKTGRSGARPRYLRLLFADAPAGARDEDGGVSVVAMRLQRAGFRFRCFEVDPIVLGDDI